jgi:hypothetical protein
VCIRSGPGISSFEKEEVWKMSREAIERAVNLGNTVGYVLLATAGADGLPHLAASRKMTVEPDGRIGISEWFCPGTLENLQVNPRISIVVWDPLGDTGFQILGRSEKVEDVSAMDGLSPEQGQKPPLPQVERKILIQVDKVIHFTHAPHSDVEDK